MEFSLFGQRTLTIFMKMSENIGLESYQILHDIAKESVINILEMKKVLTVC